MFIGIYVLVESLLVMFEGVDGVSIFLPLLHVLICVVKPSSID